MDNDSSLLASFVPRITSRGEDTAIDAFWCNTSTVSRLSSPAATRCTNPRLRPARIAAVGRVHESAHTLCCVAPMNSNKSVLRR